MTIELNSHETKIITLHTPYVIVLFCSIPATQNNYTCCTFTVVSCTSVATTMIFQKTFNQEKIQSNVPYHLE